MKKRIGQLCVVLTAMGGCASSSTLPGDSAVAPVTLAGADAPAGGGAVEARNAADKTAGGQEKLQTIAANPSPNTYATDRIIARIDNGRFERSVTMEQFLKPLVEAHGLNTLLVVVQLELAKQAAEEAGVTVTEADVVAERESTLAKLFSENDEKLDEQIEAAEKLKKGNLAERLRKQKLEDRELLLKQFLEQQRISPSELEMVFRTNAHLRKVAEPEVASAIKEEDLQNEFKIRYNEQVRVRHIQFNRTQDTIAALQRLKNGESFEKLARELSQNPATARLGGELPPFSRQDSRFPQNFKDVAFALEVGQVSDVVGTEDTFHLIKLEERIMPKLVKFEDVKETLRKDLAERVTQAVMAQIRDNIALIARQSMKILDPELEQQFKDKLQSFQDKAQAAERVKTDLERDKLGSEDPAIAPGPSTQPSTTQPSAAPVESMGPASGAAPIFGNEPATRPGLIAPATTPQTAPTTNPAVAEPAAAPAKPAPAAPARATQPTGPSTRPVGSPN